MSWLWRTVVLYLLGFAMIGTWAYNELYIPAPYHCSGFNFRLDENYCGMPLSLARFFFTGEFARLAARELFGFLLLLLAVRPFLSGLILILFGERRRWRTLHLIILGLAVGTNLTWGMHLLTFSRLHPALWGVWLYTGLAIGGLVLEFWTLVKNRRLAHE